VVAKKGRGGEWIVEDPKKSSLLVRRESNEKIHNVAGIEEDCV
jgi:hypothetical protein